MISFYVLLMFNFYYLHSEGLFITNLGEQCLRCICQTVTSCKENLDCGHTKRHCGPFYLSKPYWDDAGKPFVSGDHPGDQWAYKNCSFNYECSKKTVEGYMTKFGRDCDKNGVTNCKDYLMIHLNGGNICEGDLGQQTLSKFENCNPD